MTNDIDRAKAIERMRRTMGKDYPIDAFLDNDIDTLRKNGHGDSDLIELAHQILSLAMKMSDEEFEKSVELSRVMNKLYPPPPSRARQYLPNSVSPDLLASNPSTSEVDSQP